MNSNTPSLKDILLSDLATAKLPQGMTNDILSPGKYIGKIISFTEEETFRYITVEINKVRYNFFYNYFIRNTTDLDANLINWIKALATIPTTDATSLLDITNSAIGNSYEFEVYNYTSKSGKNAGKAQMAIQFSTLPVHKTVTIETEIVAPATDDLPF